MQKATRFCYKSTRTPKIFAPAAGCGRLRRKVLLTSAAARRPSWRPGGTTKWVWDPLSDPLDFWTSGLDSHLQGQQPERSGTKRLIFAQGPTAQSRANETPALRHDPPHKNIRSGDPPLHPTHMTAPKNTQGTTGRQPSSCGVTARQSKVESLFGAPGRRKAVAADGRPPSTGRCARVPPLARRTAASRRSEGSCPWSRQVASLRSAPPPRSPRNSRCIIPVPVGTFSPLKVGVEGTDAFGSRRRAASPLQVVGRSPWTRGQTQATRASAGQAASSREGRWG